MHGNNKYQPSVNCDGGCRQKQPTVGLMVHDWSEGQQPLDAHQMNQVNPPLSITVMLAAP